MATSKRVGAFFAPEDASRRDRLAAAGGRPARPAARQLALSSRYQVEQAAWRGLRGPRLLAERPCLARAEPAREAARREDRTNRSRSAILATITGQAGRERRYSRAFSFATAAFRRARRRGGLPIVSIARILRRCDGWQSREATWAWR